MSTVLTRLARHLRALLAGPGLARALENNKRAARDLDRAVREALHP